MIYFWTKRRKCMAREPGDDTCNGDPQLLHLAVCLSLDLPQISCPALSCWPAGSVPPQHLLTSSPSRHCVRHEMPSRCFSVARHSGAQPSILAGSVCHITVVASSASCHPDAGPWITPGYRFSQIMSLSTTGCSLNLNTGEIKALIQHLDH